MIDKTKNGVTSVLKILIKNLKIKSFYLKYYVLS